MSRNTPLVLAMDIGTTAIKVGLFSIDGDLLKVATREQELIIREGGWVEQSPIKSWQLVADATKEVTQNFSPNLVEAISLSVQRGTVIPVDKTGQPLTNFIVWMDKRGLKFTEELSSVIGSSRYYAISGHPISYITGITKLLWLRKWAMETHSPIAIIAPPETLFLKWLGCEDFVGTHSTGTYLFPFDIDRKEWSREIASQLDFPLDWLPSLVTSTEVVGRLSYKAAQDLGLAAGTPLVPGGGDGQCAAVGCGVIEPGQCMINVGTGAGVQTYLTKPLRDPNQILNCAAHVVPYGWEMEGHTQASGAVFRWFRDEFGIAEMAIQRVSNVDAFDLLVEQALMAPPGCDGLLCLPLFNGSTAPIMDQQARGVLIGLSLGHKRSHVIRAILEGISLEIRWMLDSIIQSGAAIEQIRLVGGGARNVHWNHIHADILKRPVYTLHVTDSALVGAAICASVAIGRYNNFAEAVNAYVKIKDIIEPRGESADTYEHAYATYKELFFMLSKSDFFKRLQQPRFEL